MVTSVKPNLKSKVQQPCLELKSKVQQPSLELKSKVQQPCLELKSKAQQPFPEKRNAAGFLVVVFEVTETHKQQLYMATVVKSKLKAKVQQPCLHLQPEAQQPCLELKSKAQQPLPEKRNAAGFVAVVFDVTEPRKQQFCMDTIVKSKSKVQQPYLKLKPKVQQPLPEEIIVAGFLALVFEVTEAR